MKVITYFVALKSECAHDLLCGWLSGLLVSVSSLSLSPVENNQQKKFSLKKADQMKNLQLHVQTCSGNQPNAKVLLTFSSERNWFSQAGKTFLTELLYQKNCQLGGGGG